MLKEFFSSPGQNQVSFCHHLASVSTCPSVVCRKLSHLETLTFYDKEGVPLKETAFTPIFVSSILYLI